MPNEPYTVVVPPPTPQPIQLRASDVPIGTVTKRNDLLFVSEVTQRVFVVDLIEGVKAWAKADGYEIEYVIWDPEYDRFEFKTRLIPKNQLPHH